MTTADTPAFRRGGRPRLDAMNKRGPQLRARVRPDELARVEERAAAANRTLSDYVREQALFGRVVVRQHQTLSPLDRHDLARIGSNLNQIARVLNQSGEIHKARHVELALEELRLILGRLEGLGGPSDELGQG